MNQIIESLHSRKSVRVYEEKPVSEEVKSAIIEAAIQAPTAGNQMLYSIIDVTDSELKAALSVSCDNQPFIAKAPLVFVFVADHTRWHKSFEIAGANPRKLGVGDLMLAVTDTAIAAQNMVVAAESLGLGSCYIGDILEKCEVHRELLKLPMHSVPVCMLVLGYPTESQKKRRKPERFSARYVVGENKYPHLSDEELIACYMDQKKKAGTLEIQPFDEFMKKFCNRKFNSEFSEEMTRSVEQYLKEFIPYND